MRTFFCDDYMNKMFFSLVKREVEKEQLNKTIDEINYLNELQENLLKRQNLALARNRELKIIKKISDAK